MRTKHASSRSLRRLHACNVTHCSETWREEDLGGVTPGRGEHNPTAELGFEPLSAEGPQTAALREAIASLSGTACQELYALMRIGQGHLAAKKWHHGLSEAETLGQDAITAAIIDDADLHDHLAKGLYEADLSL